jgi:hypothetical protein
MVSSKTTFQDLWAGVLSRMDLDPARFEERHVMMYRDPDVRTQKFSPVLEA